MTKKLEIVINGRPERRWWFSESTDMDLVERDLAEYVENHIEADRDPRPFVWKTSRQHD